MRQPDFAETGWWVVGLGVSSCSRQLLHTQQVTQIVQDGSSWAINGAALAFASWAMGVGRWEFAVEAHSGWLVTISVNSATLIKPETAQH